jgi:hypothetical protein
MTDMVRFTAWMSEHERRALNRVAHRRGVSVNSVVREAIQCLLFQPPPHRTTTEAIDVTRNNDNK